MVFLRTTWWRIIIVELDSRIGEDILIQPVHAVVTRRLLLVSTGSSCSTIPEQIVIVAVPPNLQRCSCRSCCGQVLGGRDRLLSPRPTRIVQTSTERPARRLKNRAIVLGSPTKPEARAAQLRRTTRRRLLGILVLRSSRVLLLRSRGRTVVQQTHLRRILGQSQRFTAGGFMIQRCDSRGREVVQRIPVNLRRNVLFVPDVSGEDQHRLARSTKPRTSWAPRLY